MNKKTKRNLTGLLMAVMFMTLVAVFGMPLMAKAAPSVHTAHTGRDMNGSSHEGWTAVSNEGELRNLASTGGKGYLTKEIILSNCLEISKNKEVTLCLNGYRISGGSDSKETIALKEDAVFNLYDENDNEGNISNTYDEISAIKTREDSKFTMNGGSISENTSNYGGGVYIDGGTFTMNGGRIYGNGAEKRGGGVYISNGELIMNGGSFFGNFSQNGGGVFAENSSFTINGGSISENNAWWGGGVQTLHGTVTMNGGSISANYSSSDGGGVYVNYATFIINKGDVTGNSSVYGAGVYVSGGEFTMKGGSIYENDSVSEGGGVYIHGGEFTMQDGNISNNVSEYGGGVSLSDNSAFTMKGGNITDNNADYGGGVCVWSGTFTMDGGNVSKNLSYKGGGVYVDEGTFTINGGDISENTAFELGGGVFVASGTFDLKAGSLTENHAAQFGGGIYNDTGTLKIYGGSISKNTADLNGGGVYSDVGSKTKMNGGTVSGNTSKKNGGGFCLIGDFSIEGGTVKNNKAEEKGNGLAFCGEGSITDGTISDTIFKDNSEYNLKSVTYNPNKGTGKKITQYYISDLSGEFSLLDNKFTRSGYSFFTWNTKEDGSGKEYTKEVARTVGDLVLYAQWKPDKYTVKFNANGGSGTMSSQSIKYNTSTALKKNTFTKDGYDFNGWNTKADGKGTAYKDGQKITLKFLNSNNITLYAQWKEAKAEYKVEHYKQKLDGTYNTKASATDIFTGKPGESVTPEVKTYKGFTAPEAQTKKISADGKLVIKYFYTRNSYKLTWDFAGGSAKGSYTKGEVKYGAKITAPVPSRAGYTFNGWKTEVPEKMPANDLTIKATWKANTDTAYKVEHYKQKLDGTYPATANESEALTGKTNASVTPAVKTYKGFTSPEVQTAKIKGDGSLVIKYYYTRNSYKLTWDFAGGSAKGSYTKGNVKYGAKITAPVPTRDGYEFTGWDKTVASKMPANDVTYKAKWRKLTQEEQVRKFVERFYTIILERPAEAAGLNDWTNRLISKTATGADVAAGFINSEEFQKKKMTDEEYVTKLYRAFFDREPDQDGYNGWLRELKNGKTRDDVLRGFINSPEFNNLCKKYGINTGSY